MKMLTSLLVVFLLSVTPSHQEQVVILKRFDGSVDFNKSWKEYQNGFGDPEGGEFWLGNEEVSKLTNTPGAHYCLHIEVLPKDSSTWYYADYSSFSIDTEANKYALHISGFNVKEEDKNAGDSLTGSTEEPGIILDGMNFSTTERRGRRDMTCAYIYDSGWWFNDKVDGCFDGCLTCRYGKYFYWPSLYETTESEDAKLQAAKMMMEEC